MNKKISTIFIVFCFVLCVLPFAGMTFFRTDVTTENRRLTEFPVLFDDGALNTDYFESLGNYFTDRFAFRQLFVSIDAEIQSKLFSVSNVDSVIKGTDGWLYYSSTLDDYLGQNILS